ncbi:ABC-type dipeptide/oligopeptide/nickel transport systems, permease component [Archaeoglobus sulfaticallidus PM70-1]|uniref:ABC-type dipeptide/oligopeptide/nickel transport systems, permease component n=1 Tax=Archaeoglobus sulfaticallidus PM70-1 TaxID=387631 RepID=N0BC93_9EURY|nr:ABC transporter permease [Archaeoglobus sulfaticallidus]AGK61239.1 ABC-type dipeptide/oligopeptide/nickel transport systems, permease component [Archaeoglobus sulfaticallidus PM70-1]
MRYRDYVIYRLILAVFVIFGVITVVFFISRMIPSDPAALWVGAHPTPEAIEKARKELHLDEPLLNQYLYYISSLLNGDLGVSIRTHNPVVDDIKSAFTATLELILFAELLALIVGIPLGVYSAVKKDSWVDNFSRIFAISGVSLPTFWFGIILQLAFFKYLQLLPLAGRVDSVILLEHPLEIITGLYLVDSLITGNIPVFVNALHHIILPALTLAMYPVGLITRQVRSMMVEVLQENYIKTAFAYGLPSRKIYFKYALKNAIAPALITVGLSVAYTLTGAFLTEIIFNWPGLGRYAAYSILSMDYPAVLGVTIVAATTYVIVNLVVDLIQVYLDPRIKL